jgi:hypothetical protein
MGDKPVRHGISDERWEDYLLGKGTPEARASIDAHLLSCRECWQSYLREYPAMSALNSAAEDARTQLAMDDRQLRPMFAAMMAAIRAEDLASTEEVKNGLDFLKLVLDPVFGPATAQRAMHLAANLSPAPAPRQITRENWDGFLERLAAMASIVCGDVFAGLIREHGQLAPEFF